MFMETTNTATQTPTGADAMTAATMTNHPIFNLMVAEAASGSAIGTEILAALHAEDFGALASLAQECGDALIAAARARAGEIQETVWERLTA